MAAYSFTPVIPVEEAIDLGTRLTRGQVSLLELKDACGIVGCVSLKYGTHKQVPQMAVQSGDTLEQLGKELVDLAQVPGGTEAAINIGLWLPLVLQIIQLIIERLGGGGGGGTVPGPV